MGIRTRKVLDERCHLFNSWLSYLVGKTYESLCSGTTGESASQIKVAVNGIRIYLLLRCAVACR